MKESPVQQFRAMLQRAQEAQTGPSSANALANGAMFEDVQHEGHNEVASAAGKISVEEHFAATAQGLTTEIPVARQNNENGGFVLSGNGPRAGEQGKASRGAEFNELQVGAASTAIVKAAQAMAFEQYLVEAAQAYILTAPRTTKDYGRGSQGEPLNVSPEASALACMISLGDSHRRKVGLDASNLKRQDKGKSNEMVLPA
jgi:hypothetical protein